MQGVHRAPCCCCCCPCVLCAECCVLCAECCELCAVSTTVYKDLWHTPKISNSPRDHLLLICIVAMPVAFWLVTSQLRNVRSPQRGDALFRNPLFRKDLRRNHPPRAISVISPSSGISARNPPPSSAGRCSRRSPSVRPSFPRWPGSVSGTEARRRATPPHPSPRSRR